MNPNLHFTDEQIIAYGYGMLGDAEREVLDKHLAECQPCRARLNAHEVRQRQLEGALKARMNGESPPAEMTFAQVAGRLQRKGLARFWPRFSAAAPLATAILGLTLAFFGIWQTLEASISITQIPSPKGTFSALACFFFMFVSMDQFDKSFSIRPRFVVSAILAFILWAGTFLIGLLNIIVVRDLTIAAYIFNGGEPEGASVVAILAVIIAAIVHIGVAIGGAEYHYKHVGHPSSWKLFSWTIAIQLLIMILPYLVL